MADKLSWSELRRALAQRANISEKDANTFLTAFNAQLLEALKTEKQVKINGLGTFKLQAVAPRKSVDVTTGSEITIEGYNKVSFVPEAGVKELIEKVEAGEAVEALEPIQKLGAQADEIVDILGDLGELPKEEKAEEPKEEEQTEEVEPLIVLEKPAKKKNYFLRALLIFFIILLILCVVGYFFLRKQVCEWFDILKEKVDKIELFNKCSAPSEEVEAATAEDELVLEVPEEAAEQVAESEAPKAEVQKDQKAEAKPVATKKEEPKKAKYEELLLTEEITEGSRLAWISRKYYGHPDYWPYLYDANRDRIDNPSNVPVGTQIRVPKLTKAQRDMTSSEYLRLKEEAVAAIR